MIINIMEYMERIGRIIQNRSENVAWFAELIILTELSVLVNNVNRNTAVEIKIKSAGKTSILKFTEELKNRSGFDVVFIWSKLKIIKRIMTKRFRKILTRASNSPDKSRYIRLKPNCKIAYADMRIYGRVLISQTTAPEMVINTSIIDKISKLALTLSHQKMDMIIRHVNDINCNGIIRR